ncbi:MAG: hypothetical protein COA42_23310, partial [Alteromonadaceae bacterium]
MSAFFFLGGFMPRCVRAFAFLTLLLASSQAFAQTISVPATDDDGTFQVVGLGGFTPMTGRELQQSYNGAGFSTIRIGTSHLWALSVSASGTYRYRERQFNPNYNGQRLETQWYNGSNPIVVNLNSAPTISSIAAQNISINTSTSNIAFTVNDAETAASSLTVTATSSNTSVVPNSGISLGGSGSNRTIRVTPASEATGWASINVSVNDGTQTSIRSFTVTVTAPANYHTVAGNIDSLTNGRLNGWVCVRDHAQSIAYHIYVGGPAGQGTYLAGGSATVSSETGVSNACRTSGVGHRFHYTFSESQREAHKGKAIYVHGISPFGSNSSISGGGSLSIPAPDARPPTASASFSANSVNEGGTASFSWSSTDATNCSATGISGVSGPSGTTTYHAPTNVSSAHNVTAGVTCTGAGGASPVASDSIRVNPVNDTPTISTISDQETNVNTSRSVSFTVNDEETPSSLTVSVASNNNHLLPASRITVVGSGTSRTLTLNPHAWLTGSVRVTLTVSDGSRSRGTSFDFTARSPAGAGIHLTVPANDNDGVFTIGRPGGFTGLSSRELQIQRNGGGWQVVNAVGNQITVTASGTYKFREQQFNVLSNGTRSGSEWYYGENALVVSALPPPTPEPMILEGGTLYDGVYHVAWPAVLGPVDYYQWRERTVVGGSYGAWQNVGLERQTEGLSRGNGNYSYQVEACNAQGCSDSGGVAKMVIIDSPPSLSSPISKSTTGEFDLSWTRGNFSGDQGHAVWIYGGVSPNPVLVYYRNSTNNLIANIHPYHVTKTTPG